MSKFNKTKPSSLEKQETTNLAGGDAYVMNHKLELVIFLLTKFLSDQFYESEKEQLERLVRLFQTSRAQYVKFFDTTRLDDKQAEICVKQLEDANKSLDANTLFVAKACLYARNKIGMRSVTHAMAGEIALHIKNQPWLSKFFDKIIRRPDDILEIAAYFWEKRPHEVSSQEYAINEILGFCGRKIRIKPLNLPNCVKRGFRKAFNRFNDYQLSKYAQVTREIKLVDIVNLVHPKPTEKNKASLEELVKTGTIKNLTTSQRALTDIGQSNDTEEVKGINRRLFWSESLVHKKLGYLDLLRSLTKIIKECPDHINYACDQLTDKDSVKKSLVMPYQVWFAIKKVREVYSNNFVNIEKSVACDCIKALYKVLEYSMENIPELPGRTLVVCDYSGSMDRQFNESSSTYKEIGTLMGALLSKKCDADFMIFGDDSAYLPINNQDTLETIINSAIECNDTKGPSVGHCTNFHSIFKSQVGIPLATKYDRIVIFSDMQGWGDDSFLNAYKNYCTYHDYIVCQKSGLMAEHNPFMYMFDLSGHGSLMLPESKTFVLGGFSDKVFSLMSLLEKGEGALIDEIEKVDL